MNDRNPEKIIRKIAKLSAELEFRNDEYLKLLNDVAEREKQLDINTAKAITEFKINGEPATLIPKLATGKVASLKFDLQIAQGILRAHISRTHDIRSYMDGLRSMLAWYRAEKTNP
jgi:hypothetical protein